MRAGACTILSIGAILIAAPACAAGGRYDPNYPVCMEAAGAGGSRIECVYTSIEQCREGTFGSSGTCFNNPSYVPRPAQAAPVETDPEPPKPRKSAGRYDPDYPVCMQTAGAGGSSAECIFMSYEQCRQGTFGSSATCFNNPSYVPPPAGAAPAQTEPEPPAKPRKSAGRYDPDYPVCMEAVGNGGGRIECFFTSYEQCRQATFGSSGTCFNNPSYVPPPVEAAPVPTEPAPPAKPVKSAKLAKSAKSTKSVQAPPSPQPAPSQR